MPIENISDTARWVAVYRAQESERPDAIFRDPYARRLAGERGHVIEESMRRGMSAAWAMIVRTAVFDEIILDTIAREKVDLVMNLAAGLDARPWRMALSPTLRWVDVDLPAILEYKADTLRDARPVCRYEAIPTDLTDVAARRALFARLAGEAQRILVVTEGLLVYLTADQVTTLASDLHAMPSFGWWLIDLGSPRLLKMMNKRWGHAVKEAKAPFQFAPAEGTEFFRPLGWRELQYRGTMEEAQRLKREMAMMWFWRFLGRFYPARTRAEFQRMSGIVLLGRE
jgi:methyltransferase (TIGR00027 family)